MGIILAILIFGFIVAFHEFGHFIIAKLNHIQVFDFSIGFGPSILHKTVGETTYNLRIIPLGGMCQMGEDTPEGEKGNFNEKSVWVRMLVVLAGPFFNFILAFLLAVILIGMTGYDKPVIGKVMDHYPAQEAGLQAGDEVISINGRRIHLWREISLNNAMHPGETVRLVYERNNERKTVTIEPAKQDDGSYLLGISPTEEFYTKPNALTAVKYGYYEVAYSVRSTIDGLKMLLYRKIGVGQLSGPIGIGSIVNESYNESKAYGAKVVLMTMLSLAILLSANLGVMNLLPIPALDGGRILFLLIEAVRHKRIPPEKEGFVHLVGMGLLLLLMAFVMYNDITKLLGS